MTSARLDIDAPLAVASWRPLVHWLLALPHIFVAGALRVVRQILLVIAFFSVLFSFDP